MAALCRYPPYRETLPGGRSYLTLDQVDGGPRRRFRADHACPPAICS